jgi:hypothetical protein
VFFRLTGQCCQVVVFFMCSGRYFSGDFKSEVSRRHG